MLMYAAVLLLLSMTLEDFFVSGHVKDPSGTAVAGAQVAVEHLTSGARRETQTDAAGAFGFDRLPLGTHRVTVAKPGFFAVTFELRPEAGKVVEVELSPITVLDQEVDVTARPLPIDPDLISARQEIGERQIQQLPYSGRRNFLGAAIYTPGTVRDREGTLRFHGSGPGQVRYLLDGIDLMDPSSGTLTSSIPIDAVESADIDLVGYSAEYGKASGGVVRANSQLIGNAVRWELTDFVPGVNFKRPAVGEFSPRLRLSGPVVEDRLWGLYSASVRYVLALPAAESTPYSMSWIGEIANMDLLHEMAMIAQFVRTAKAVEPFTKLIRLTGDFDLTNGVAHTDNLEAVIEGGGFAATGTIDLPQQALNLRLTAVLSREYSEAVGGLDIGGLLTTALANAKGELVIPVIVTGTFQNPQFRPDLQKVAEMKVEQLLPSTGNPADFTTGILGELLGGGGGEEPRGLEGILGPFGGRPPEEEPQEQEGPGQRPPEPPAAEEAPQAEPERPGPRDVFEDVFEGLFGTEGQKQEPSEP